MPFLQKLDNKGKPMGSPQFFKDSVARKLLSFKNSKFLLVERDKPKISRENPEQVDLTDFPKGSFAQMNWARNESDIEKLNKAKKIVKAKIVLETIEERLKVLQNK